MLNRFFSLLLIGCLSVVYSRLSAQNDTIQMAVPGDFTSPYTELNGVFPNGIDVDGDMETDIFPPCSCREDLTINNGDDPTEGLFDDQLIIATGVSGQTWLVESINGAFDPATLDPILPGTPIPEVGTTGYYVLPIVHKSDQGYLAFAFAPSVDPNLLLGPVTNTCYFPRPFINNLDDTYCEDQTAIALGATTTSGYDDNIMTIVPFSDFWVIERLDDGATFPTNVFDPSMLGPGDYRISYSFNANDAAFIADNNTGCVTTVQADVTVREPQLMACNSSINITLPPTTCEVVIVPAILLAVDPVSDDFFDIQVIGPMGQNLGNTIPADFAGLPLIGDITDLCSGENCLTDIIVNDLADPVLNVPADATLSCTEEADPLLTGIASADDCSPVTINYSDQSTQNTCGNPKIQITRTWVAVDAFGNTSEMDQIIDINRADMADFRFPRDTVFACDAVLADPSLTQPTADGAGIPNLVNEPACGLFYVHEDDTISICGNPQTSYIIIREWTVLEECGFTPIEEDGAGNDNLQLIRVLDTTGPTITTNPFAVFTNLSNLDNGLQGCSSTGFIPPADVVMDGCNDYKLTILTPLGEADYVNGLDGEEGGFIPFPGLPIGIHPITYQATDNCGNVTSAVINVTVLDNSPPIMICESMISLTLSADGTGRIFPQNIDEGSRDDCCEGDKRLKLVGEPDAAFRPFIDFFCTNDTVEVVLRIWDCYGNFNECDALVIVEDAIPPYVAQGVDDVQLTCQDDYSEYLDAAFDAPVFEDNCNVFIGFDYVEQLNDCGSGTLTRTWTAGDNTSNPPATFTQTVFLNAVHDYRFSVPSDSTVSCEVRNFANVEVLDTACDLLDATVMEEIQSLPDDTSCIRIIRTHQIINWCEYDGQSDPVEVPRWDGFDLNSLTGDGFVVRGDGTDIFRENPSLDVVIGPSTGYYQYQQIITVYDDEPPTATATGETVFCVPDSLGQEECTAMVDFPVSILDNCTDSIEVIHSLYFNNQSVISDPFGTLEFGLDRIFRVVGEYPLGDHAFVFSLFDDCGNFAEYYLPFSIKDCAAPVLECPVSIALEIPISQNVTVSPNDILLSINDNCGVASVAFDTAFAQLERVFVCDELGTVPVTIWARDFEDNRSSCSLTVTVLDDDETCIQFFDILGQVQTPAGDPVGQVKTRLIGPMGGNQETEATGLYAYLERPDGGPYTVSATKDINHKNGVTVLDLIFANRHIIGVQPLDTPYKVIAADVDRSGSVSIADLIYMRRMILSLDTIFPNNTSWRMIPADHVFDNPINPLNEFIPEDFTIDMLTQDTIINFVGVKVGDVDDSAMAESLQAIVPRDGSAVNVEYTNQLVKAGKAFEVAFRIAVEEIEGFQFELSFDSRLAGDYLVQPGSGMTDLHFNKNRLVDGGLPVCWTPNGTMDTLTFTISGYGRTDFYLDEWLDIESAYFPALAFSVDQEGKLESYHVRLSEMKTAEKKEGLVLFPNYPNPFFSKTNINFYLAKDCDVQISIFSINGNIIIRRNESLSAGLQTFMIEGTDLGASGTYFYQVRAGETTQSGKLVFSE